MISTVTATLSRVVDEPMDGTGLLQKPPSLKRHVVPSPKSAPISSDSVPWSSLRGAENQSRDSHSKAMERVFSADSWPQTRAQLSGRLAADSAMLVQTSVAAGVNQASALLPQTCELLPAPSYRRKREAGY